MDRGKVLTAVVIFFISLAVAVVVGLSLGAFVPPDSCTFPVAFDRTTTEMGVEATVTQVEGSYRVAAIGYKAVVLDTPEGRIIQEGNLTDLSPLTPGLSFHPMDASTDHLQAGDRFRMTLEGDVHLILVDGGGTPIGWTLGCDV
ncbi:MAG: hypothetical protein ACE5I4_03645 [Thermoplasmata archaeon]